jgi:hypothetical protein
MTDTSKLPISRIDELITKLDEINTRLINLENRRYITETWSEGNNWYRVWSDGWIEQGGMYDSGTASGDKLPEISLNISFTNNLYTLIITPYQSYTSYPNVRINNQLIDKFIPTILNTRYIRWYACGY